MNSDLLKYIRVVLRWSWVTALVVLATVAVILYMSADTPIVYTATVKFEVSPPEPEQVTLYSAVRTGTVREEISTVQADFSAIARGAVAARMTISDLGLKISVAEMQDKVMNEIPPFSSLVYIHVTDANAQDAATLARVHAENTLKYYGESRAQATAVRRDFITQQLQQAAAQVTAAREELVRFQAKNGTADLMRDLQGYQDALRTLRVERDRNMVEIERATAAMSYYAAQANKAASENDAVAAGSYRASASTNQAIIEGMRAAVERQNELIAQRSNELISLVGLTAEYERIRTDVQRAEANYNFMQSKLNEAQIKESDARSAGFIQMIEPASVPTQGQKARTRNVLLPGIAASLLAGIMLSFVLDLLFGGGRRRQHA